jgi:hypothetical protein
MSRWDGSVVEGWEMRRRENGRTEKGGAQGLALAAGLKEQIA